MDIRLGLTINEISIGDNGSFSKTISESDIYLFAGITGDFNPMHVNEEFCKKTPFRSRIAHGGITTSLIAPVLGTILPGLGTVALETMCKYKAPVFPGDTVTAKATVTGKDLEKNHVTMELKWTKQDGTVVATGMARVMPPRDELKQMLNKENSDKS